MKFSLTRGVFTAVLMLAALALTAQEDNQKFADMLNGKDFFYADPVVFYPYDSAVGRLDLYLELPLENLQFKKNAGNDNFEAVVEFSVLIKSVTGDVAVNQSYSQPISTTKNEQKTIADRSVSSLKNYYLPSGKYKMTFAMRDKNSSTEKSKEYDIEVKNPYIENLVLSGILLLSDYKISANGEKEIEPLISGNVGTTDNFYLFFEGRNRGADTLYKSYKFSFLDDKGGKVFDTTVSYVLKPGYNTLVTKINNDKYYIGSYKLNILDGSDIVQSRTFTYRWLDTPVNLKDLDKAISQMMYIATSDELDYIKEGKTKEERMKRFVKFWKAKDPTPNTPKNELLNVYYSRVKTATERYSHFVEGWKTDMGMVYILFGNPSTIDRHPFDADSKPYEIWTYYEEHRQFVFIDDSGFGDYRLVTPIYDDRTRIRY